MPEKKTRSITFEIDFDFDTESFIAKLDQLVDLVLELEEMASDPEGAGEIRQEALEIISDCVNFSQSV